MKSRHFVLILLLFFLAACKTPPKASFTFSPTDAEIGETIVFSNTSSDATSYSWDFGDGATSTSENPTHVYSEAGNFGVELTATGEDGSDSYMVSVTIGWPDPIADFSMDKSMVIPGETVTFTNASQWAESYSWDFGDGSNSTVTDPTHSYTSEGIYTVTLTADGYNGGNDSYSTAVNVCYPPEADFTMSSDLVGTGEDIQFTNGSIEATTYLWDFGDGTTSTSENPTHNWTTGGVYTVQLTATGDCGSDTYTDEVTVYEVNIFPGVGVRDIELVETWATVEAKLGQDAEYLGYTIDNGGYISHVWESQSLGLLLFLVSPTASYSPSSDDILWLMGLYDTFVGSTAEGIRMGSTLSDVVAAYGSPDRIDDTYFSYFYDVLGIRTYFCCSGSFEATDIIDLMSVFLGDDTKKSAGIQLPANKNIDIRNIKSQLRK